MNNNNLISNYTNGVCKSFIEFQVVAKKYGIYFEKINNEIIVCYDGEGNPKVQALEFFKVFYPETDLTVDSFDLISNIQEFHFRFLKEKINQIAQKYSLPPIYNQSMSLKDNGICLLNALRLRNIILKEDIDIIKYILNL